MSLRSSQIDADVQHELDALDAALRGEPSELAAFVVDVRDAAPRATPAFLAALEARVEDGFPARDTAAPVVPRRRWSRRLVYGGGGATVMAAVAAVAVITVAPGGGTDDVTPLSGRSQEAATPASAAPTPSSAVSDFVSPSPSPGAGAKRTRRSVERNVSIDLAVAPDELQKTSSAVIAISDRVRGIVQTASIETGEGQRGEARLDLQVPTRRLGEVLSAISKVGSVTRRSENAQDVTDAVVSSEDRLTDARAQRRALLQALGRADTPVAISALRERLRLTRGQITDLQGQLRAQRARTAYASIVVVIRGDTTQDSGTWSVGDAARDALRVLETLAGVLLVGGAIVVPLALAAAGLTVLRQRWARRQRERALGAS